MAQYAGSHHDFGNETRHHRVVVVNAAGLLSGRPYFVHWGVVQISLPNLLVVVAMVVLFVLALILPFPPGREPVEAPTVVGGNLDGHE